MAVCEHCNTPVTKYDKVAVVNGYSYHDKCHVCSETNLHNAEVFKGCIFCSSCSQRIFQGCSTARKNKESTTRSRDRYDHRRRLHRPKERECKSPTRIIELAGMNAVSSSSKSSDRRTTESNTYVKPKEKAINRRISTSNEISKSMKKSSAEMGTTTEVTQELLRQMNCPVVNERKYETYCTIQTIVRRFCTKPVPPERTGALTSLFRDFCSRYYGFGAKKRPNTSKRIIFEAGMPGRSCKQANCRSCKQANSRKSSMVDKASLRKSSRNKKKPYSDLRIAELGTSTEIANMALKHKYELPVIIRSKYRKPVRSHSESLPNESDDTRDRRERNEKWVESTCTSLDDYTHWTNKRLTSIIKLPIKSFKKNILERSSLINIMMKPEDPQPLLDKIKIMFHEEINDHQKRGLKKLYSTINRQKTPNKLGWLSLIANVYCNSSRGSVFKLSEDRVHKRCKHFNTSHSYRCMRAQVMKMAGPTKSELAMFRAKVRQLVTPGINVSAIKRRHSATVVSLGCGNSPPTSTKS